MGGTSEDKLGFETFSFIVLAGVSTYLLQVQDRILLVNAFQNQERDGNLSVQFHAA